MKTSNYFSSKVKKKLDKFFDKSVINSKARSTGFSVRKSRKISSCHFIGLSYQRHAWPKYLFGLDGPNRPVIGQGGQQTEII